MNAQKPTLNTDSLPILSVGLFADLHYAQKVYGNRHCQDSLLKLQACVDRFNARDLSLAINLGDSLDGGEDPEAELGYLAAVSEAYARFRGERHLVLGNHDLETLTKDEFLGHCGVENAAPYGSFNRDGIHFVLLDSNYHQDDQNFSPGNLQWDKAWISAAQLQWLEKDLGALRGGPVVVCCHGNLDHQAGQAEPDPHVVRNAAQLQSILERAGNVWVVIGGHYHPGRYAMVNGIPYISLSAMVEGPGLENNAYAILHLYGDGSAELEGFDRQGSVQVPSFLRGRWQR